MRVSTSRVRIFLVCIAITLVSCGGNIPTATQTISENYQGQARYQNNQPIEPPEEFKNLTNPMAGNAEDAAKGEEIFKADCASCHGQEARGDGLAGTSLDPKPTNLASEQANLSDGYLFWRISEGGTSIPFHSSMPAWKGLLSEDHIWKVITYLRTLKS